MRRSFGRVDAFRWGLVPHWANDLRYGVRLLNARAETASSKPAFADSLARRRCLVPADGFFEWSRHGTRRQPYFIHSVDGAPLAFAGLWAEWSGTVGGAIATVNTVAIITCAASDDIASIHDRMPVLVERDAWADWLRPGRIDPQEAADLMAPPPQGLLTMHPVGRDVGNVANDHPGLVEPVPQPPDEATLFD